MKNLSLAISVMIVPFIAPVVSHANTADAVIDGIIGDHIVPRFETLAQSTQILSGVAAKDCDPASPDLRSAYGTAFDAWVSASHLRFGPSELGDRAFALAFWPDSRGATPKALTALLSQQDPIATSVKEYAQVSIAARGFYAMEFLLYDDAMMTAGTPAHHCQLVRTISADIAETSQIILDDWTSGYADMMENPSPDGVYRTDTEVLQEMFKSLTAGLQFTSETRLGRPLGTFDRPRPTRAEVRRSGRSSQHVMLSLTALQDLASRLADDDQALLAKLNSSFGQSMSQLSDLDDPTFAGVAKPQTRIKVEIIQQSFEAIRNLVRDELGPTLGVAAGFNSLDGD